MALTAKQERFVAEYLIDLNATQAAIRAGYSKKTAKQVGSENLTKPDIQAAVSDAQAKRSKRTEVTQDRVLAELAKVGFSDLRRVLTSTGGLIPPQDWDDETAGAIGSLEVVVRPSAEVDEDGNREIEHVHKIKAWDKLSALEKIGKHLGMFGGEGASGDDAPGLNITIATTEPVSNIRVTRHNG